MSHTSTEPETWRTLLAQFPHLPANKLRWWLSDTLACSLTQLPLDQTPSHTRRAQFLDAARRLEQNEPVQYICGKAPFLDFEVNVTPDVLIPRPETEQLAELILKRIPDTPMRVADVPMRVADVGTGSGCLAIALKRARPMWQVTGIDISEKALHIARENARMLGADIHFTPGNLLEGLPPDTLDLIVANLPYIGEEERNDLPPEVRDHEPALALFADHQGTDLVLKLMQQARTILRPGGSIFLETGEAQGEIYRKAAPKMGWTLENLPDLAHRERFRILSRIEA